LIIGFQPALQGGLFRALRLTRAATGLRAAGTNTGPPGRLE